MVEFLIVFVSVLLLICVTVFAADFVPIFKTWLKRIHIGRYADVKQWYESAEKKALEQIEKLPPLPVTDKSAYTLFPKLKGEYYNNMFLSWQVASLFSALCNNEKARDAASAFLNKEKRLLDNYAPTTAMLLFSMLRNGFDGEGQFDTKVKSFYEKTLKSSGEGTLPYNPDYPYRYVDTLGMVCPFLIKYHQVYGSPEALELAKRQFDEFYTYGINEATGLPIHCFSPDTKMPLGLYGWGRGCGWLALALTESIKLLDGKDEYANVLKERAHRLAESLLPYQNKNGSFNCIIGVSSSREDSSATAMIGGLLALLGYKNESEACLKYIMSVTRRNGEVDFAQGDTMGIGNYSRRFESMPAAQGFALVLAQEVMKNETNL